MEIKTSELFSNITSLPPKDTKEFEDLISWEIDKCLGGVHINGIHIPGWLYWHTQHWHIRVDKKDNYGNIQRIKSNPYLRDNEWMRAEALEKCRIEQKGYIEVGARQGAKSETEASYTGYIATLYQNTQNVVVGGNDADLSLIKDKIRFGVTNLWEGIKIPFLDKDWRKPMIRLGFKTTSGEDEEWAYLIVRNVSDGKNTEGPAGTTAKAYIIDEIGKFSFSQAFEASKPAFISEFGWRAIPILMGTGGAFDKGSDAERFFYHPEANNFLSFEDPATGKKTGLFMSGLFRQDCKKEMSLGQWLTTEKGMIIPDTTELDKIVIKVSDKEKAEKVIRDERAKKAQDPDITEYLKQIMYYPLTPEECFLSSAKNFYNASLAKTQRADLLSRNVTGTSVILGYDDFGKVEHKFAPDTKRVISSYPLAANEPTDAPVQVWEFPIPNPPYGLYVAGIDPFRFGSEDTVEQGSLGAVYIYKRMHSLNEEFQDMFVAAYVAKTETKEEWNETARMLIKWYNARAFCESDDYGFIEYMKSKKDEYYLEPCPAFIKQQYKGVNSVRQFGVSRASAKIREHLRNNFKTYMEEKLTDTYGEDGSVIGSILGVKRILDPVLLEEVSKWNIDGNYDREVAASIAITCAKYMDPIIGKTGSSSEDPRYKAYFKEERPSSKLFQSNKSTFSNRRNTRKLFRH